MFQCKVKGIHIAERDTQTIGKTKPTNEFWNTYNLLSFKKNYIQPMYTG